MSEFNYMVNRDLDGEDDKDILTDLNSKWTTLDASVDGLGENEDLSSINVQINQYFDVFNKALGLVEGAEESKKNYEEIYNNALMQPINLSIGIMLLSVLIYELYSN